MESRIPTYFHFAPILLGPGSVIEPGNFGRIIRLQGAAHPLFRREMAYEAVRASHFDSQPSRLDCLFGFPTVEEAQLYRTHIQGYAASVLYEVESADTDPHVADMNNGVQHFSMTAFDPDVISYYWRGWQRSPDPQALILREVLLRSPGTVLRKL